MPKKKRTSSRRAHPRSGAAPQVQPDTATSRQVGAELRAFVASGAKLRIAGAAKSAPEELLQRYTPRHKLTLFGTRFYFTDFRYDDSLNFFVGYVILPTDDDEPVRDIYPRIFYKDISLIWRVASHFVHTDDEYWIGKGAVRTERIGGAEFECSAEDTTNLPYEMQAAMDTICRRAKPRRDARAVELVLRRAPAGRIAPYADFSGPRMRARADRAIYRGRRIASFAREGDPRSLQFAAGYEPDFGAGLVETSHSASRLYSGALQKHRILSKNRVIQYQFVSSPTHCWVNPPQAMTTELMSYGVRTVDVIADDNVFVPGFEYHYMDDTVDPPALHTQIPDGFAGEPSELDPSRADASAWIEALPVVRQFRRQVVGNAT